MKTAKSTLKENVSAAMSGILRRIIISNCSRVDKYRSFDRIVIVAPLEKNNGISKGAKYQYKSFCELGLNVELIDSTKSFRNPFFKANHRTGSVYIFHCAGPHTPNLIWSVMPYAANAYRIAYWAWELPDPALDWRNYDALVDEIWTPSEFSRSSLRKMTSKPIHVVPHFVGAQPNRRVRTGGQFRVLAMADSRSSFSRKNPAGAVHAFRAAFGSSESAQMYLKLSGSENELSIFRDEMALSSSANISVISDRLSDDEIIDLYSSVDVMLSLHRSEGFGLPMIEAMSCGTPVIATNWSGNVDFMNKDNSLLVKYRIVPVIDKYAVYGQGVWAEPDIECASSALKSLSQEPDRLEKLSIAGYKYVLNKKLSFPF